MGKRSNFKRVKRDFYPTPLKAVEPLFSHLWTGMRFCEPCAGDGALIDHLETAGLRCEEAWDIEPQRDNIDKRNALEGYAANIDCFITNPPWSRDILHPLIGHLSDQAPTWLLFDADWVHTRQSSLFMYRCVKIVSVGRVKWIPDSKMTGKDNCAWHLFDATNIFPTQFFGRNLQTF